MIIKIKRTNCNAKLPMRTNPTDCGADLISPMTVEIPPQDHMFIDLGFQMEIPENYGGFIYARSGLGSFSGITPRNCVGVIDCKYRGNVGIMVENKSDESYTINKGDRIAQIVISPIVACAFEDVEELDELENRGGGFGHSGKQ